VAVLRPGGVGREALAAVVPRVVDRAGARASPGHTPSHYAPVTEMIPLEAPVTALSEPALAAAIGGRGQRVGLLCAVGPTEQAVARLTAIGAQVVAAEALSEDGDSSIAAQRLFAALRHLDAAGAARILAEPWGSAAGLGAAIRDRLARAAGQG
jgi:hypothetical protein